MDDPGKEMSQKVEEIVRPLLQPLNVDLVGIEYSGGRRKGVVRIYIDKEGGVTLDDCERVSRHVSHVLDVEDVVHHSYTLEVSSPGLHRPLRTPSDYQRRRGRIVKIQVGREGKEEAVFVGRIKDVEGNAVRILTEKGEEKTFSFHDIVSAKVEVEFSEKAYE